MAKEGGKASQSDSRLVMEKYLVGEPRHNSIDTNEATAGTGLKSHQEVDDYQPLLVVALDRKFETLNSVALDTITSSADSRLTAELGANSHWGPPAGVMGSSGGHPPAQINSYLQAAQQFRSLTSSSDQHQFGHHSLSSASQEKVRYLEQFSL